ncbi:MAG: CvpA family protein [Oscillospiraceae bacterium]|nr:CvpA family protein [Oscillospiraceae bacterium]
MSGFGWIFDILVIVIIGYVLFSNAKRGVCKVLIFGIGYIVAALIASFVSFGVSDALYEAVARESNISAVETANSHTDFVHAFSTAIEREQYGFELKEAEIRECLTAKDDKPFDERIYNYIVRKAGAEGISRNDVTAVLQEAFISAYGKQLYERLPEYVRMDFTDAAKKDPQLMRDMIHTYYDESMTSEEKAEKVEDLFSKEPTKEVLQIFLFLIMFSILMVIAAVIGTVMQNKMFFNIRTFTDHALGGVIGLIEAAVMVILIAMIVRLIVMLGGGNFLCFNDEDIRDTWIFRYFYDQLRVLL